MPPPWSAPGCSACEGTPDTSGYGGLQVLKPPPLASEPPYGGYFDAVAQALGAALSADGSGFGEAVERVVVDRGELTFHVRREHLLAVADKMLHDPALRFEIFSGVSGVHYPKETGRELHAVYHLVSITHNRRVRLEVSAPDADPHVPSVTSVYPAANWHERETWDFLRDHLRRAPRAHQDRDARRLAGPPAAQGLPARRHPGRVPRHQGAAAG